MEYKYFRKSLSKESYQAQVPASFLRDTIVLIGQAVNKIIPAILSWAAWPLRGDCVPQVNGGKQSLTALFE